MFIHHIMLNIMRFFSLGRKQTIKKKKHLLHRMTLLHMPNLYSIVLHKTSFKILTFDHCRTRTEADTYGTRVEALVHVAPLGGLQRHVLAEACVEAEGERQAALHPPALLEAAGSRLHVQQHLGAVVVGQGHAAHQSEEHAHAHGAGLGRDRKQRRLHSAAQAPTRG